MVADATKKDTKGFTLIELLVVIAIIAVLSVVVILTLNPASLLQQARDSTRVSDMSVLKSAVALYMTQVTPPTIGAGTNCYVDAVATTSFSSGCNGRYTTFTTVQATTSVAINGNGWIPVNFSAISSGAPISVEPKDPINNATYFYAYAGDNTNDVFELTSVLESSKYTGLMANDGGVSSSLYEVGSKLGL